MDEQMESLQHGINIRQLELQNLVDIVGRSSHRLQLQSNVLKVGTIILSAVASAKGVADSVYGAGNTHTLVFFTVVGMLVTVALGFEAAFKLEKRATELGVLSATIQGTIIRVDSEWRRKIGSGTDNDLKQAARELLTIQDGKLEEIHQKAAVNGLTVTIDIRAKEKEFLESTGAATVTQVPEAGMYSA